MPAESTNTVSQWRTRPVFISSTFRDMQAERDYLRNFVLPRLEEEMRKRRHHMEWIDLRQGVESGAATTEEQRELIVLKVCLDEIKRSRPFLIVLLGDRYGWVPPGDRMEAATREAGFQTGTRGKSVTALEIEFGIFKESPEQQRRCFFYLREPLPYEKIPAELRANYSEQFATDDQAAARRKALNELKDSLNTNREIKPRIRSYKADWDPAKNSVTGLEAWGETVFQDVWKELEVETAPFAATPAPTWEETERASLGEFVEQRSRDFTGREETIQQLLTLAHSPAGDGAAWAACITGTPGSGKSALFAKLHKKLESDSSILLLANAAGATMRGSNVDSMLRRWIADLAALLDVKEPLPEKATVEAVDQAFASLLGRAAMKRRVVVLLDALNQFELTPRAKHLTWRPKLWPPNARLIATALPGAEAENFSQWAGVKKLELPPLTAANAHDIAQRVLKRYHVPWHAAVWRTLAGKKLPDGNAATGNPLWTTLACEQLALLDADDFARAEHEFAAERDPQARLMQLRRGLAERMPPDVPGLYEWLLTQTEKVHGAVWARSFAVAIALSRYGWRENDLRALIPKLGRLLSPDARECEMTPLALAALRRSFRAHVACRGKQNQWDFSHAQEREAVRHRYLSDASLEQRIHRTIADHLESLPSEDSVRDSELMGHLIAADDPRRAALIYARLTVPLGSPSGATDALVRFIQQAANQPLNPEIAWVISLLNQQNMSQSESGTLCRRFLHDLDSALRGHSTLSVQDAVLRATQRTLEHLTAINSQLPEWHYSLSVCLSRIGDVLRTEGDLVGARKTFQQALAEGQRLAQIAPTSLEGQHLLAFIERDIGRILYAEGHITEALDQYQRSFLILQHLCATQPSNADLSRDLCGTYEAVGNVLFAQGHLLDALNEYRAMLKILERLTSAFPSNLIFRHDLGCAYIRIGNVFYAQAMCADALDAYQDSLAVGQQLAVSDPSSSNWQSFLSVSHEKVGNVQFAQGDFAGALASYLDSLVARKRLVGSDPSNTSLQRDLSVSNNKVGDVLLSSGDLAGAQKSYTASFDIIERLAESNTSNAVWQYDVAACLYRFGNICAATFEQKKAVDYYRRCHSVLRKLQHDGAHMDSISSEVLKQLEETETSNYYGLAEAMRTASPTFGEMEGHFAP